MRFTQIKTTLAAGLFMLFFATGAAQASFINGEQLRIHCMSKNPSDDSICIVYITGVVDALTTIDLISAKTSNTKRRFCLPDNIGPNKLKAVILNWLEKPETDLDFAASLLIFAALSKTYGCQN